MSSFAIRFFAPPKGGLPPSPPSGQSLSPEAPQRTISLWDNPHTPMKFNSLLPALAALALAVTASAQSDPSVGGSFGTSFDHSTRTDSNSGLYQDNQQTPQKIVSTTTRTNVQNRSFWDKMTGRNRTISQPGVNRSDRSPGWFHHASSSNRGWFGHSGRNNTPVQRTNASWKNANANTVPTNTKSKGWHMPFFHRS